ncbi:HAD family hydrolase [Scardovia inopinata]|uniref:HAD family hydrolase n=1 Tax=Scardovia inopinata TaxID=78259 RepID=UPI000E201BD0
MLCAVTWIEFLFSSAIGYKKPSARFFSYIVKTVGARADKTLMIGNEEKTDMAGSHALGMDGILLNTGIDSHSATLVWL